MKIFDITVQISPEIPVWPGEEGVIISQKSSIEKGDDANVSHLSFGAHTGTHVDAPYHFIADGVSLDQIPLERFVGDVQVVEVLDADLITVETLKRCNINIKSSRLLFKTKNSDIWAKGEYRFQEDFVALSQDAAQFLVDRHVQLVGIDYLSIAPYHESTPTHKTLLGAGVVVLEGIDLSGVKPGEYILYCLPLKLNGVDGAPARAILVEE